MSKGGMPGHDWKSRLSSLAIRRKESARLDCSPTRSGVVIRLSRLRECLCGIARRIAKYYYADREFSANPNQGTQRTRYYSRMFRAQLIVISDAANGMSEKSLPHREGYRERGKDPCLLKLEF